MLFHLAIAEYFVAVAVAVVDTRMDLVDCCAVLWMAAPIMASRHRGRVLLYDFECLRELPFTCDKQSTGGLRRCWGRVDAEPPPGGLCLVLSPTVLPSTRP